MLMSETYIDMEIEEPSLGSRRMPVYINTYTTTTQEGQISCSLYPHKGQAGLEANLYLIQFTRDVDRRLLSSAGLIDETDQWPLCSSKRRSQSVR